MAEIKLNSTILVRRGTTSEWAGSSYVLKAGEFGFDSDLKVLKVGNGSDTWAALTPVNLSGDAFNNAVKALIAANVVEGATNGTIKVNGTDVKVHGLGSAAYTDANAYATAAQGTKADTAVQTIQIGDKSFTVEGGNATLSADDLKTAIGFNPADYDPANAASTVKSELIGNADTDTAESNTIAGAKKYADTKVASVTNKDASIVVDNTTATAPQVSVHLDSAEGNALKLVSGGLRVDIPAAVEYNMVKDTNNGDYAAVYHLTKGGVNVGASINIPKDVVVKSGEVVELADGEVEGYAAGTYIKLVLQNDEANPLYVNVSDLIEYVTSGSATGDMVVVDISSDHKVTATITDGTVTKAKLHADVQASLGKADTAVQTVVTGTTAGTIKVDNTDVAVNGLGSAAYQNTNAFDAAGLAEEKANAAKEAVIGTAADTKDVDTVKGAKAFATDATNTLKNNITNGTIIAGKATADGAGNNIAETYATKTELTDGLAEKQNTIADVADSEESGKYVAAVKQTNGKIEVVKAALPAAPEIPVKDVKASTENDSGVTVSKEAGVYTVAHKKYETKPIPTMDTVPVTTFMTGMTVANGHVTEVTATPLQDALEALGTITFDGGKADGTYSN